MTERKFTDEEVIKALVRCGVKHDCADCCFACYGAACINPLIIASLDLIKRQRAEIERLKSMNQAKLDMIHDLRTDLEQAKVEAIKEFAEILKDRLIVIPTVYNSHYGRMIDKLVKELTESKPCTDSEDCSTCELLTGCEKARGGVACSRYKLRK